MPFTWYESVPSGLRWVCDDCSALVVGGSELDTDDEIDARLTHKPGCPTIGGRALDRAATEGEES